MAIKRDLTLGIRFVGTIDKTLRDLDKRLGSQLKGVNKEMKSLSQRTASVEKNMHPLNKQISKVSGALERLKAAMKVTLAYGVAATAIYRVVEAFQAGVSEIINFDQALKNLQAITKATDAELAGMGKALKDVARSTKFSTGEVAEGMVLLGQAGFSAGEALDSIQAVADLATGTLSNMQLTTDLLTTTVRAFNLQASESTRVADIMASAINQSKLTIDKLRIAFNFVGAAAAQTGLSLEETAATMMVLANNGLRASTIGTGMRQVLSRLLAPTGKLKEAFAEHGVALDKVNPRLVGYQTAIKNLTPLIWDNEKGTVDMAKAYQLFGLRGAQAAAVLIKSYTSGDFQNMLDNVYDVGASAEMAGKQQEGLGVKLKNLADRAKLVALAFGNAGVKGIIGGVIDTLRIFASLVESIVGNTLVKAILQTAAWTAAFIGLRKALLLLLGTMKTTTIVAFFQSATKAVGFFWGAMNTAELAVKSLWATMAAHPVAMIILAIAAATVAIKYMVDKYNLSIKALRQHVRELEAQRVELDRNTDKIDSVVLSLEALREKYGENVTESREYVSMLQRLLNDHPELAKRVDMTKISYQQLLDVLKEWNLALGAQKTTILIEEMVSLTKVMDKYEKRMQYMTRYLSISQEAYNKVLKDRANAEEDILAKGKILVLQEILRARVLGETSVQLQERIRNILQLMGLEDEHVRTIVNMVIPAYERLNKVQGESGEISAEAAEKASDKILAIETRLLSLRIRLEEDLTKKARLEYEKRLWELKKNYEELIELEKKNRDDVSDIYEAWFSDQLLAEKAFQKALADIAIEERLHQIQIDIENQKQKFEEEKRLAIDNKDKLEDIRKEELKFDAEIKARVLKIWTDLYNAVEKLYGKDFEGLKELNLKKEKAETDLQKALTKIAKEGTKQRIKTEEEEIERGYEISAALRISFLNKEIEEKRRAGMEIANNRREITELETKLEQEKAKKILQITKDNLGEMYAAYGAGSDEYADALEAYFEAFDNVENKKTESFKENIENRMRIEREYVQWALDHTKKYSEEWKLLWERAYQIDLINQQEYLNEKSIAEKDFWDKVKYYMDENASQVKSWAEQVAGIMDGLAGQISDGMAGAFWDVVDGTKTASEAFADFAKDTLEWLTKMIIRTMIWNALMGGAGAGSPSPVGAGGVGGPTGVFHSGGIVGRDPAPVRIVNSDIFRNAPRLHSGMGSNEYPAILEKGEGVFTQEQMAAMGGGAKVDIINVVDIRMMDSYLASPRGRDSILNVINGNRRIIRRIVK